MHIPEYAGLLSVNVNLFLCITTKSLSIIFVTCDLVFMSILNSIFCCLQVLQRFYFFFSIIMSCTKYRRYSLLTKSKGIITIKYGTIQNQYP